MFPHQSGDLLPLLGGGGRRAPEQRQGSPGVSSQHFGSSSSSALAGHQQHNRDGGFPRAVTPLGNGNEVERAIAIAQTFHLTAAPFLLEARAARAAAAAEQQQQQRNSKAPVALFTPDRLGSGGRRTLSRPLQPSPYYIVGEEVKMTRANNALSTAPAAQTPRSAGGVLSTASSPQPPSSVNNYVPSPHVNDKLREMYNGFEHLYAEQLKQQQQAAQEIRESQARAFRQQMSASAMMREHQHDDDDDSSSDDGDGSGSGDSPRRRRRNFNASGADQGLKKRKKAQNRNDAVPSYARPKKRTRRRWRGGPAGDGADSGGENNNNNNNALSNTVNSDAASGSSGSPQTFSLAVTTVSVPSLPLSPTQFQQQQQRVSPNNRCRGGGDEDHHSSGRGKSNANDQSGTPKFDTSAPPALKNYMQLLSHWRPETINRVYGCDRDSEDRNKARFLNSTSHQYQQVQGMVMSMEHTLPSAFSPRPASLTQSSSSLLGQQHQQTRIHAAAGASAATAAAAGDDSSLALPASLQRRLLGGGVPPSQADQQRRHNHEHDVRQRRLSADKMRRAMLLREQDERPRSLARTAQRLICDLPGGAPSTSGDNVRGPACLFPPNHKEVMKMRRQEETTRRQAWSAAVTAVVSAQRWQAKSARMPLIPPQASPPASLQIHHRVDTRK